MGEVDDGALAPYAAGSSIAFAPEICIPALMAIKQRHPHTWGRYGFWDAFNPSFNYPDVKLTHGRIDFTLGLRASDAVGRPSHHGVTA